MYLPSVRKEQFGSIVSFADGWIDFYDSSVDDVAVSSSYADLQSFSLGNGKAIFETKAEGRRPADLYAIPPSVFNSSNPLKAPVVVQIEVTLRCNLKCKHCFNYSKVRREYEMTTAEIIALLDQLSAMDVMSVFFTGGEATLRSDLPELITHASRIGLNVFLLTNGTRLNRSFLNAIPRNVYFVLSFDGKRSHELIHGGLSFERMQTKFSLLREYGFTFSAQYVAQRNNIEDLVETYQWCAENRVDFAAIDLYPTGRALANPTIFPDMSQLDAFRRLAEAKFAYEQVQKEWEQEEEQRRDRRIPNPYHFTFIGRLEEIFERSFSGVFFAYVASNGEVYPDNWHGGEALFSGGNLRYSSFEEIWNDGFLNIRELVRWSNWKRCHTCPVSKSFCDYRLPVLSRNLHGGGDENLTLCGATEFQRAVMLMRTNLRNAQADAFSNDQARQRDIW